MTLGEKIADGDLSGSAWAIHQDCIYFAPSKEQLPVPAGVTSMAGLHQSSGPRTRTGTGVEELLPLVGGRDVEVLSEGSWGSIVSVGYKAA